MGAFVYLATVILSLYVLISLAPASSLNALSSVFPASPLRYHPIVIWHGLGDSAYSEGMQEVKAVLEDTHPGIFVHLVHLADNAAADQKAGIFGEVNDQVEKACEQLASIPELKDGFDAVGFSQGGQFLRAYVQRCNKPAVRNLVTFGSQHQGIADLPACRPADFLCKLAESALRFGVYSDYAQHNVVSAQYFRNPLDIKSFNEYLSKNAFIADINNERRINKQYIERLQSLDNFVMLLFSEDTTVSPKESSWFSTYPDPNTTSSAGLISTLDAPKPILPVPLRKSPIYKEDRLGLAKMDKRGALVFEVCEGPHMSIDRECTDKVFGRYIGIAPPSSFGRFVLRPLRDFAYTLRYYTLGV
ncbi:hypothetical protein OC846_003047 [Tilletia horrida]|uniref:Palmitoyl-protein thioesterase 1 n=1 Tax=Tilletia horrida TaxID=155126 RepID=A0AAN6GVQ0_9BASI|nr:hypothetical protein OC846_003047 [Tilletia horrida]KAK0566767.1 hypothetical protein OC861_003046 [Tilletia horrida]